MRRTLLVLGVICLLPVSWAACGGTVELGPKDQVDPGQDGGKDGSRPRDGGKDSKPHKDVVGPDTNPYPTKDALPDYYDPGCPYAPEPIIDNQCNPLKSAPGDCSYDEACYPYVVYPSEPCEPEEYGSVCLLGGFGVQGDPCEGSLCAPNHVCVITGSGTQCVRLCDVNKPSSCSDGLVCEPIDVFGYGGCL